MVAKKWGGSQQRGNNVQGGAKGGAKRAQAARFRSNMNAAPVQLGRRSNAVQQAGQHISAAPMEMGVSATAAPMTQGIAPMGDAPMGVHPVRQQAPAAAAPAASAAVPRKGGAAGRKPKRCSRAKQWSPEVEEAYRFQQAGWRDAVEYEDAVGPVKRFDNGFVKCTKLKENGFYTYWTKEKECVDKYLARVKVFEY